jgi:hypothetical protein
MDLSELTAEEQVALVALLEMVIESNARVSEDEADRIDAVVAAIGEEAYRRAAAEVDRRFHDEADLRAFVPAVTRQEARDVIYGTVLDAAISDPADTSASELLEWLADAWEIAAQIDEPEPPS